MTGILGSRSRGVPSRWNPSNTFASFTTGNRSPIGCSRPIRPFPTSCMAAVPVTALVIDAMRNTESRVIASVLSTARYPKAPS